MMPRFLLPALFVIACAASPQSISTTRTASHPITVRWGIVDDAVRDRLTRDWDAHEHDQPIMERAYCLRWRYDWWGGEIVYRVTEATPATIVSATTHSVNLVCPRGPDVAELHTHPPQTCASETVCWPGGMLAWQCMPSDPDVAWLWHEEQLFGAVQCDRHAVVFYARPSS